MDIKKYLTEHGISEGYADYNIPLAYTCRHFTADYFDDLPPVTYDKYVISLDCDSASKADFVAFDKIKRQFNNDKTLHVIEDANPGGLWLKVMTMADFDKMDIYNQWQTAANTEIDILKHHHYKWFLNHTAQFNRHAKTIMHYYSDLYKLDKADLLHAKALAPIEHDFEPDTDDYLPF